MSPTLPEPPPATPSPGFEPGLRLHVDGGVYRLLAWAKNAADSEPAAIYEHLHPFAPGVWTRPLAEFNLRFAPLGKRGAAALMAIDPALRQADVAARKARRRALEEAEIQKTLPAPGAPSAKLYSLGLMFSTDRSRVALIRKATPQWQAGKLNGVGGKAEPGETARQAMVREFHEETGVLTEASSWQLFARLGSPHFEVHVFRCFDDRVDHCQTLTHEMVVVENVDASLLLSQGVAGLAALACCALDRESIFARLDYDEWARQARDAIASIIAP